MYSKAVMVSNKVGLHARPASIFISNAKKYKSSISVIKGDTQENAKSIIDILSAGIGCGTEIIIEAEGEDEREAVNALAELVENCINGDI